MSPSPWLLSELTWAQVREQRYQVAVLPWGATEPHNLHLPYGTDVYETEAVAAGAARRAWERGARVVVLPAVPFGANAQQLDIPLTLDMSPSTQAAVLADVARSLDPHGLGKLVVLNGHGGNDFKPMIRELQPRTRLFLCAVDWYRVPGTSDVFDEPGDHAGELETSLMLHVRPDLVAPLGEAGKGAARAWKIEAFRRGWAWAPRRWTEVTRDTGVGDPALATREKGEAYLDAVTARLADFLVALAEADPADMYEDPGA